MGKFLTPKLKPLQYVGLVLLMWFPTIWYLIYGFVSLTIQGFYFDSYPYFFISSILGIILFIGVIFIIYNNPKGKVICIICCFTGLIGLVTIPWGISEILVINVLPLDAIPLEIFQLYLITSIVGIIGGFLDWMGFHGKGSHFLRRQENISSHK